MDIVSLILKDDPDPMIVNAKDREKVCAKQDAIVLLMVIVSILGIHSTNVRGGKRSS